MQRGRRQIAGTSEAPLLSPVESDSSGGGSEPEGTATPNPDGIGVPRLWNPGSSGANRGKGVNGWRAGPVGRIVALLVLLSVVGTALGFPAPLQAVDMLPEDNLVVAPKADPRAPRNHFKIYYFEDDNNRDQLLGGEGALTQSFGLARWGKNEGARTQLSLEAGVFSQFQETGSDYELVSADYFIGFPLEFELGEDQLRLNLFHMSSHLGDEFQQRTGRSRISFSHETLRALYFWVRDRNRFYFGGEYHISITPDVDQEALIGGFEYYLAPNWYVATDLRARGRVDWDLSKTGLLAREFSRGRFVLALEGFDGPLPVGQFFRDERTYMGLTFRFNP